MMMLLESIWGSVSYVGAVLIACTMIGWRFQKKPLFGLRFAVTSLVILGLCHWFEQIVIGLDVSFYLRMTLLTMSCVVLFFSSLVLMRVCFSCSVWQALFCVTTGYCLEHLSHSLFELLVLCFHGTSVFPYSALMQLAVRGICYVLMYRIVRKADLNHVEATGKTQVLAALLIVTFAIIISNFAGAEAREGSNLLKGLLCLYSFFLGALGIFVEFYQVYYQRMKSERNILQQLLYQESQQYQREKETANLIHIKYHDLKHQLHILESQYGPEHLKDMRRAIDEYDTFFHTGNPALDTILTMKSYACASNGIQFTCMADGTKLNQLSETDVYSLFGNVLDNAIEAVSQLEPQRRMISMNVMPKNGFLFIHCENYCDEKPEFVNGVPQTTKADKDYHGVGTQSLQMLAERYHGSCSFSSDQAIFKTDIVLPL